MRRKSVVEPLQVSHSFVGRLYVVRFLGDSELLRGKDEHEGLEKGPSKEVERIGGIERPP
jgi:hypothetical protein